MYICMSFIWKSSNLLSKTLYNQDLTKYSLILLFMSYNLTKQPI